VIVIIRIIKKDMKESEKKVLVVEEDETKYLPKTKVICPKCGNDEAYWFIKQMRAGDEPPTVFYTCVKCEHKWRSYG